MPIYRRSVLIILAASGLLSGGEVACRPLAVQVVAPAAPEWLELQGGTPGTRLDIGVRVPVTAVRGLDPQSALTLAVDDRGAALGGAGAAWRFVAGRDHDGGAIAVISADLPGRPGAGATAVRVQGTLVIRHGGELMQAIAPAVVAPGAEVRAGPISGSVRSVGPSAMNEPGETLWEAEVVWRTGGAQVQAATLVGADGTPLDASWLHAEGRDILQLPAAPAGPVRISVSWLAGERQLRVPVDLTVPLGVVVR